MSFPSDKDLIKQIHAILVKAYETDTVPEHSARTVRAKLASHFGVDLEARKKEINKMTNAQNELISATWAQESKTKAQASTSRSPSPAKPIKAKAKAKTSVASVKSEKTKSRTATGTSSKRKQLLSDDEDHDDDDDGEEDYDDSAATADAITINTSDPSGTDEDEFSELEEDTSVSRSRSKKSSSTVKKSSSSSGKKPMKKPASASTSSKGSEAEQRLTRLKKLVSECGVRKPWKNLYEAAGIASDDYARQCTVVQGVLKELGMTGKGSMEQAQKIRSEREFADELAALQDNPVLSRARKTRGGGASASKPVVVSEDDEESEYEVEVKRSRKVVSDSEDEGPRRKSFKSSLASFAADLNSDSD